MLQKISIHERILKKGMISTKNITTVFNFDNDKDDSDNDFLSNESSY